MKKSGKETGKLYERAVGYYLEQQGYVILEYNYRKRTGEIDLIALDGEYLVFCEVKYRRHGVCGSAMEAVGKEKQRRIVRCAQCYLQEHFIRETPCRFDVVGIDGKQITLVKNAFQAT